MPKGKTPNDPTDAAAVIQALEALLAQLPPDTGSLASSISLAKRKHVRRIVGQLRGRLADLHVALDSVKHPASIFDPSDPQTIGELIAQTLLIQPSQPLGSLLPFYGSGVYAIYYHGAFKHYLPVSGSNTPLYVGKVDPKTRGASTVEEQGAKLYERLVRDHAKNIKSAENLALGDFDCRYLVVKSAWQNTAETYLIDRFRPIWNNEVGICFGIGKHGDAAVTRSNTRSPWDTLHPGRKWAWSPGNKSNPKSPEVIGQEITKHFQRHPAER